MKEKLEKREYDIDPDQGAVAFIVGCRLKGYEPVKMIRKGRKATVWYRKRGK